MYKVTPTTTTSAHDIMNRVIGIDIGGTQIKMAAFTTEGQLLAKWTRPTEDKPGTDVPPFAQTVRAMLAELAQADCCVGLAAPGVPALHQRWIEFQPGKMHGIERFDWTEFLGRSRIVPVLNDAHAALLGEAWQGAAVGCRHAILLTLGTGVGGAILADGKLFRGALGRAGHFGHVSITDNDDRSIFGTPGSLEAAIGNYTVARRSGGRFTSTEALVDAYAKGDPEAAVVWLASIRALARAITSFINILDPELVIIGGGIARSGSLLFDPLNEFLDQMEWRPAGHRVRIVPAALGEWAGTYGAARLALETAAR